MRELRRQAAIRPIFAWRSTFASALTKMSRWRDALIRARPWVTHSAGTRAQGRPDTARTSGVWVTTRVSAKIEEARDSGAPEDELIDAFPDGLLKSVGYYGRPDGAAAEFRRLSGGLDIAIVRIVATRPGVDSVRAVMQACAPQLVASS